MNTIFATMLALSAALDWSVQGPLDVPMAIEKRQGKDETVARVYAARGEFEGFHLSIAAGKKGVAGLVVAPGEAERDMPAPSVFRLFPLTGAEIVGECLDVLAPPFPATLGPGETAHYWVRYAIPVAARVGVRQSELRLLAEGERAQKIPVRIEIFDAELPQRPTLPNIFYMNRPLLRASLGLPDSELVAWEPIYNALSGYRLGFSLWDGTGLTRGQDASALRAHLSYAAENLVPAALDLSGGNGAGWRVAAIPDEGQRIDPLNLFLNGVATAPALAGTPLVAAFDQFPERAAWPQRIKALSRLDEGSRLLRVAAAPLHPDFEPHLDAWAVPFRAFTMAVTELFRAGVGIGGASGLPKGETTSSSNGMNTTGTPYRSDPRDAADGSLLTAWMPQPDLRPGGEAWWQVEFEEPVQTETVVLRWLPGHAITDVQLSTSLDGDNYAASNVKWEHRPAGTPLELPTSTATLRFPGAILGIRLVVSLGDGEMLPAIAEVSVPSGVEEAANASNHAIKPWLALELDTFPTTYPGRHRVEPRMIGWVCWMGGFQGVLGASLDQWPKSVQELAEPEQLSAVDIPQDGGDFIFYPMGQILFPSLRLERLRDGLEDYELLQLFAKATQDGRVSAADNAEILRAPNVLRDATPEQLDAWAVFVQEARVRMGRALSTR